MEYIIQDSTLQGIADAIRSKTGDTAPIQTDAFANAISLIETGGGGDTSQEDALVARTLTEYTNSRVTRIGDAAFQSCHSLTNVSFPAVTNIGASAFFSCSKLTDVNFPAASLAKSYAFAYCYNLVNINFPALLSVSAGVFCSCSILASVTLPALKFLASIAFANCPKLTNVSLPAVTTISSTAFSRCSALTTLYLAGSTLCSLKNSNAFSNAGITSTTGSIYVPASLLTAYQEATNWAYFSTQFVPIEE